MPRTWFTSDTHFGHANIIKHCNRPFYSAAAMDAALIANWNAVVARDDTVWHLGDFTYKAAQAPADYLSRLNGQKHLLWGNHDSEQSRMAPGWESSQPYAEMTVDDTRLVLFHYSLKTWHRVARGALQLYGHSHGRMTGDRQSGDVGVDAWDFRPVSLDAIKARLAELPLWVPVDHHGMKNV